MPGWAGPTTMAELYLLKLPVDSEDLATAAASGKRVRAAARPVNYIIVMVRAVIGAAPRIAFSPGGTLGKGAINCIVLTLVWVIIAAVTLVVTTSLRAPIVMAIFALEFAGFAVICLGVCRRRRKKR